MNFCVFVLLFVVLCFYFIFHSQRLFVESHDKSNVVQIDCLAFRSAFKLKHNSHVVLIGCVCECVRVRVRVHAIEWCWVDSIRWTTMKFEMLYFYRTYRVLVTLNASDATYETMPSTLLLSFLSIHFSITHKIQSL